jgi:hypothetical protein
MPGNHKGFLEEDPAEGSLLSSAAVSINESLESP